jgi:Putative phage serine protease XkdF
MKAHRGGGRTGPVAAAQVVKTAGEKRYTLCVVYPVNKADVAVAADGWRDFAGPDAIEDAAWSYLRKGGQVGLWHLDGTEGAGQVVESYIHRSGDWVIKAADGSTQTVHDGDWLAGIQWDEPGWQLIKQGKLTGLSMQGVATRRMPTPEALAGLRKSGKDRMEKALRKAARKAVKEQTGPLAREAKALRKRVSVIERSGPVCVRGHANRPGARFCATCGAPVGGVAVDKSVAAVEAPRQLDLIRKARSSDPATRDAALSKIMAEHGPDVAARVVSGDLTVRELAGAIAKATAEAQQAEQGNRRCRTCGGRGRLLHPVTGEKSRRCDACHGTGVLSAGEVPDAPDAGGAARDAAKAAHGDIDALGKLIGQVGPIVAARLLSGESVSAEEFARGYVSAGRARQSAAAGQTPRVPQATHMIRPFDFTRGPLAVGQSRAAPGSQWPGAGGQRDWYGPGSGIRPDPGSAPYPQAGLAGSNRPGL